MSADLDLRAVQAPLKARYREEPASALLTLSADGDLDGAGVTCSVRTGQAVVEAGLHPYTGGDGLSACSGDLLLQALVACAGVTLRAVARSLEVSIDGGRVVAEGDLDFRGTLGVDRDAPVGFRAIRVVFELDTPADEPTLQKLCELTERYCVVHQSLSGVPERSMRIDRRREHPTTG
ncbi:OsmC family protein [Egicoccus sp. AB-alg6-2]|uniref:OsmC family protein n=1 Tax=Egicoccus sp. AB-alg6-2 TaxID=3242692 RepID=UPI00359DA860